jgi:hypothetical protein
MNFFHILLFVLKIVFVLLFAINISGKYTVNKKLYLLIEITFKVFLSLYIQSFIFFTKINIPSEDKVIITFASGLLLYDAFFNDLSKLLELYNIKPFFSV